MKKQWRPIVIRRANEKEVYTAIEELEKRGFTLVSGPTSISKEGKHFTRDYQYNRKIFQENIHSTVWYAKLQKIEDEEVN